MHAVKEAQEAALQQQQQQPGQLKFLQEKKSSLEKQLELLKSNLADAAGRQEKVGGQYLMKIVPHCSC